MIKEITNSVLFYIMMLIIISLLVIKFPYSFQNNFISLQVLNLKYHNESLLSNRIRRKNNHLRYTIWLANEALNNNDLKQAEKLLSYTNTDDQLTARLWGQYYLKQNNAQKSVVIWEEAGDVIAMENALRKSQIQNNEDEVILFLETLSDIRPEEYLTNYVRFVWKDLEDLDKAEDILMDAINDPSLHHIRWKLLDQLGWLLIDQSRFDEALRAFQTAIEAKPDAPQLYSGLGKSLYLELGDTSKAIDAISEAILLAPDRGEAYVLMGDILADERKYLEADNYYKIALSKNPMEKWWYIKRANVLIKSDRVIEALGVYERMINKFPDFSHGYYELANFYFSQKNYDKAMIAINKALESSENPKSHYHVSAGLIYEEAGMQARAIYEYKTAVKIDPKNTKAKRYLEQITAD